MNETPEAMAEELKFPNGEILKKRTSTTYLGNDLNSRADLNVEVTQKSGETRRTWLKLAAYWKATNASTKWQLIIFDAVVRSKLMYGLETAALTEALNKK